MSCKKNHTKDIFKTLTIILAIIITFFIIMFIKYTPAYKVTLSGEIIGFVSDKSVLERKIINYINNNSETIAHKQLDNLPEYELKLIPRNIKIDDNAVFEAIENTAIITYKADEVKLNVEQEVQTQVIEETKTVASKTTPITSRAKEVKPASSQVDVPVVQEVVEPVATVQEEVTPVDTPALQNPTSTPDTNIWKLSIPKINLEASIAEGTTKDILNEYIGHFPETVIDNGNVGLAAHNRGYRVNYFNGLKNLEANDMLYYTYNGVTKVYAVVSKDIIYIKDWSKLEPTTDERLTLITCVENEPQLRLCVQAVRVY